MGQAKTAWTSPTLYTDKISSFLDQANPENNANRNTSYIQFPDAGLASSFFIKGETGEIPDGTWATVSVTATQPLHLQQH